MDILDYSKYDVNFWVGVPDVDWLSLTSFENPIIGLFHSYVVGLSDDGAGIDYDASLFGYRGPKFGGVFTGVQEQRGKIHGFLGVPGARSSDALGQDFSFEDVHGRKFFPKCTRVDLQLTVPLLDGYRARNFADYLKVNDWNTGGRRPGIRLEESENGFDTIYMGSRSSERFARLYVKGGPDGERFLRFEVQFNKPGSDGVYRQIIGDSSSMGQILRYEWEKVPEYPDDTWNSLGGVLGASGPSKRIPVKKRVVSDNTTVRWLITQVVPVLRRYRNDHNWGEYIEDVLIDILFPDEG